MKKITQRTISHHVGVDGNRNDPTQVSSWTVFEVRNGHKRVIKYKQYFDEELYLNGRRVAYGRAVRPKLLKLIGCTPEVLQRAYDRIHPYFDDPMGNIGMYV